MHVFIVTFPPPGQSIVVEGGLSTAVLEHALSGKSTRSNNMQINTSSVYRRFLHVMSKWVKHRTTVPQRRRNMLALTAYDCVHVVCGVLDSQVKS